MKLTPLAIALLSASLGLTTATTAQQVGEFESEALVAQFRVNPPGPGGVTIDLGGSDDGAESGRSSEPSGDAGEAAAASSGSNGDATEFSGEYSTYADDYNGFAIDIPAEFAIGNNGQTTDWNGPILDGSGTLIYVNAAPIPGVSSQTLYDANFQQYQQDRFYTDVEPVEVFFVDEGKEPVRVPAFRAKEVDTQRGTRDSKVPDDIHRWHLLAFGNDRTYTMGFTGAFQTFQDNEVQDVYEQVIDSVKLIPIVE